MGRVCAYCKEKQRGNKNISFMRFPINKPMREMWLKACPKIIKVNKTSVLCSKHFTNEQFNNNFGRTQLKKNAVPKIFEDISDSTLISSDIPGPSTSSINLEIHSQNTEEESSFTLDDDSGSTTSTASSSSSTLTASPEMLSMPTTEDDIPYTITASILPTLITSPKLVPTSTWGMRRRPKEVKLDTLLDYEEENLVKEPIANKPIVDFQIFRKRSPPNPFSHYKEYCARNIEPPVSNEPVVDTQIYHSNSSLQEDNWKVPVAEHNALIKQEGEIALIKTETSEETKMFQDNLSNDVNNYDNSINRERGNSIEHLEVQIKAEAIEDAQHFQDNFPIQDPLLINEFEENNSGLKESVSTSSEYNAEEVEDSVEHPFNNTDVKESKVEVSETKIFPAAIIANLQIQSKNYDLFGEYISKHMQKLPDSVAIQLQLDIQSLILNARLKYVRDNNLDVPDIVDQRVSSLNDSSVKTEPVIHKNNQPQIRKKEQFDGHHDLGSSYSNALPMKQQKNDFSATVQNKQKTIEISSEQIDRVAQAATNRTDPRKPTNQTDCATTTSTDLNLQPIHVGNNERTEYDVFAEYVTEQLKAFPNEMALQLQLEFQEIIKEYCKKNWSSCVRIKTESINDISQQIDG